MIYAIMVDMDNKEAAEALESLREHPGWKIWTSHVDHEWGARGVQYQRAMDQALDLTDSQAAASQARQVRSCSKLIESLMRWPAEQSARLRREALHAAVEGSYSRRGGL